MDVQFVHSYQEQCSKLRFLSVRAREVPNATLNVFVLKQTEKMFTHRVQ